MKKVNADCEGFTLIEVIVAIGISSLLLLYLSRLFTASFTGYNLQEQLTDINQNAKFTIKELSDVLMQAGADLQLVNIYTQDRDTIIKPDGGIASCKGFTIKVNPRGGIFQIPQKISPAVCSIQVDNASSFRYASMIGRVPGISSTLPFKNYTFIRYDSVSNFVVFSPADSFFQGDAICSYVNNHYYLKGSNLCLDNDTNVLAENLDSLSITFLDQNNVPTPKWAKMRSVQLYVCTKTSIPDRKYNGYADHCHRAILTHVFRLRNKVEN
jgi:prepilin-type N-terminal cleavage/methylation domain-containing protein